MQERTPSPEQTAAPAPRAIGARLRQRLERLRRPLLAAPRWRRAALVAAVAAGLLGLIAANSRVLDRMEHWLGDWRFALAGERLPAAHPDIALVLIREESLIDAPAYSPVDRALLARLIARIDAFAPRAIGLDFVFDKPTAADPALLSAIRAARAPVILGAYEPRRPAGEANMIPAQIAAQKAFLAAAERPTGYLNIVTDFDDVVRRRAARDPDGLPKSFADLLAETNPAPPAAVGGRRIDWLLEPETGGDVFTSFYADQLAPLLAEPDFARAAFQDRIVVIGAGLRAMTDYHETPLDPSGGARTFGAAIVAQMTAQRLDGRGLVEFGAAGAILAAAGAAFLGALSTLALGRATTLPALPLLFALDLALFAWADVITPLGAMLLAWTAAATLAEGLTTPAARAPAAA